MHHAQQGILAELPQAGSHMFFTLAAGGDPLRALKALQEVVDGATTVVGIGQSLLLAAGHDLAELRVFPAIAGNGFEVPSTPFALWCWLRGSDRGELVHRARRIAAAVEPDLQRVRTVGVFQYDVGRDLTGYEDGTENPQGDEAVAAAIVSGRGAGIDGSSFVAVQQWMHDLARFQSMSRQQQDHSVGRDRDSNEELEDAPLSAHVKRTAQESFAPEAFVLRRSQPWSEDGQAGLMFVAFGRSFDAYEALLRRMVGGEDGVVDALFSFTRPLTGSYFWCPPMNGSGRLDLRLAGL
jgi:putative iron-dependent peroxidase